MNNKNLCLENLKKNFKLFKMKNNIKKISYNLNKNQ